MPFLMRFVLAGQFHCLICWIQFPYLTTADFSIVCQSFCYHLRLIPGFSELPFSGLFGALG
ncbi:hypothetical protein TIFTF001_026336 [Ficus carica]|uniref:Uncharacterized protein n=1 Tax=Ficus carica TaxID=3494 RepID=A0AA88DL74_FICCA|nr:hypothetical protein TIFTF001_026336 [Ficus carica]